MEHMGPKAKVKHLIEDVKGQLHQWMVLPSRFESMMEQVEQSKLMAPAQPSNSLLMVMGALLSGAGIAVLLGQTIHIPHWHFILGGGLLAFGVVLMFQRKA